MKKALILLVPLLVVLAACEEKSAPAPAETAEAPVRENVPEVPEGAREVPVKVGHSGYRPNVIRGEAGESLVLVFTRVEPTECGRFVTVQGTEIKAELPMNEPVRIPVKVPDSGRLIFACGMDMMHGIVVPEGEPLPEPGSPEARKPAAPADHEGGEAGHEGHAH